MAAYVSGFLGEEVHYVTQDAPKLKSIMFDLASDMDVFFVEEFSPCYSKLSDIQRVLYNILHEMFPSLEVDASSQRDVVEHCKEVKFDILRSMFCRIITSTSWYEVDSPDKEFTTVCDSNGDVEYNIHVGAVYIVPKVFFVLKDQLEEAIMLARLFATPGNDSKARLVDLLQINDGIYYNYIKNILSYPMPYVVLSPNTWPSSTKHSNLYPLVSRFVEKRASKPYTHPLTKYFTLIAVYR